MSLSRTFFFIFNLVCGFAFVLIASSILVMAQTQIVINVVDYGANGSDQIDDTLAVQSALKAAEQIVCGQDNTVKILFPAGRYIISSASGLVVPSYVTLSGSTTGESIIVNSPPPGAEPFVFTTHDWNDTSSYISIARADDRLNHPTVPNNSYQGLKYVYLKQSDDIQYLRNLGVPAIVSTTYSGLKSGVASGATLSNNAGATVPQGSDPKLTLQKEIGVNPTPLTFNTILAVDDLGKVTLRFPNRLNWGVDVHTANESLATYYNPSYADSQKNIVTGPAWLVPANNYHHDISFENLVFEADVIKSNQLYGTYGLYIGYTYNVSVKNCKFRNLPGVYPILAIRAYNVLIEESQFAVQGYSGVTLDAGSGFKLYKNTFTGGAWPETNLFKLLPAGINFIVFDELPIDVDIVGNQFSNLNYISSESNASGQAIRGMGGAYLKVIDNTFSNIERRIIQAFGFNSNEIVDSNVMSDSPALLLSGTGAGMVNLYNNKYTGGTKVSTDGIGFDSYNYKNNPTNYACNNSGVTINQWFYPTTYLAANYNQDGTPIIQTNLINVGGSPGVYDVVPANGQLNLVQIDSINLSSTSATVGSQVSLTVNLSAPIATDFPFYLIVTSGNPDAVQIQDFLLSIPAGQQQVTLSNEVLAIKPGIVQISAKPLCSTSTQTASSQLTVQ